VVDDRDSGIIRSRDNPHVKIARALRRRKAREDLGLTLLEGVRLVGDALSQGWAVQVALYTRRLLERPGGEGLLDSLRTRARKTLEVAPDVLSLVSDTETSQGVVAVVPVLRQPAGPVIARTVSERGYVVLLEEIRDPGNVGAIIRSAAASGCSGIVIGPLTSDPWSPKALRASMGAAFRLAIAEAPDWSQVLHECAERAQLLVADVGESARPPWQYDLTRPTFFLLANEGTGPSDLSRRLSHGFVKIPMPGGTESLNVAASASILLYETLRQRFA